MREYEFELLFKVNSSEEMNVLIDRLYEAGCDDALIGSGKSGVIGLSFTREAASAAEAFESAIKDVKKAIPTASLLMILQELWLLMLLLLGLWSFMKRQKLIS
jgi:hypothetical protein